MVKLPGGSFQRGSEKGAGDEKPVRTIAVSAFLIDRFEVDQEHFRKLTGLNPSKFSGDRQPVDRVSWYEAALYCNERSRAEGLTPCYDEDTWKCDFSANGYRLPTEAEWEYACRGGKTTEFSFGDDPAELSKHAWFKANSADKAHASGEKPANAFGLCDMEGNLLEWCNDFYEPGYYAASPETDPRGPEDGKKKVARGGAWDMEAAGCRVAVRRGDNPDNSDVCLGRPIYGFRCVRSVTAAGR